MKQSSRAKADAGVLYDVSERNEVTCAQLVSDIFSFLWEAYSVSSSHEIWTDRKILHMERTPYFFHIKQLSDS
jgi:hypothetical protein